MNKIKLLGLGTLPIFGSLLIAPVACANGDHDFPHISFKDLSQEDKDRFLDSRYRYISPESTNARVKWVEQQIKNNDNFIDDRSSDGKLIDEWNMMVRGTFTLKKEWYEEVDLNSAKLYGYMKPTNEILHDYFGYEYQHRSNFKPKYYYLNLDKVREAIKEFENISPLPITSIGTSMDDNEFLGHDAISFISDSFWSLFPEVRKIYIYIYNAIINANRDGKINSLPPKTMLVTFAGLSYIQEINFANLEKLTNIEITGSLYGLNKFTPSPNLLNVYGMKNQKLTSLSLPDSIEYGGKFSEHWTETTPDGKYGWMLYPAFKPSVFAGNPLTSLNVPARFESLFKSEEFLSTIPTRTQLEQNMTFY